MIKKSGQTFLGHLQIQQNINYEQNLQQRDDSLNNYYIKEMNYSKAHSKSLEGMNIQHNYYLENIRQKQHKIPASVRSAFIKKNTTISFNDVQKQCFNNQIHQEGNTSLIIKCSLCEYNYPSSQMITIGFCQHFFCSSCLKKYSDYKISVMQDVICPEQKCMIMIDPKGSLISYLSKESQERFRRNLLWKQTVSNPNMRLCPTQQCEGIIDISQNKLECLKCKVIFCKQCQLPSHSNSCDANFESKFQQFKRCPKCQMFIEKIDGCNHMICRCSFQFCYLCLQGWEDSHYRCGVQDRENIRTDHQRQNENQPVNYRRSTCMKIILVLLIWLFFNLIVLLAAFLIKKKINGQLFYIP